MTNAIDAAKARLTGNTPKASKMVSPTQPVFETAKEPKITSQVDKTPEKTFQTYKSSLPNQKIAMPNGKMIRITSHQYITDMEDEIEFLDNEIKLGFPYLTKTGEMTSTELDPMSALRAKIIAEYEADKVPAPVLGDVEKQTITPAHTVDLGKLASGSNSADA